MLKIRRRLFERTLKMQKIKLLAAITLALASSASFAQASKSGFYGVAQFGTSQIKDTLTQVADPAITGTGSYNSNAWQIGLGFDLNEYAAAEVTVGSFLKSESKTSYSDATLNTTSKNNVSSVSLTAFGKLPIGNIKLMAGPTYTMFNQTIVEGTNETSVSKGLVGLSGGASIALDAKTDIRATYTTYQPIKYTATYGTESYTGEQKLSTLLVGLTVKF